MAVSVVAAATLPVDTAAGAPAAPSSAEPKSTAAATPRGGALEPVQKLAWGAKPNDSVFEGRRAFTSTTQAYQAAFVEIHGLMRQDLARRDPIEYGFEIVPGDKGTVRLGHLIRGNEDSVAARMSDNAYGGLAPPRVKFKLGPMSISWGGSTQMPAGHSHTGGASTAKGASNADVLNLLQSRPLGGKRMSGVFEFWRGALGYKIELDARVRIPPALLRQDGPQTTQEIKDSAHWIQQQLNSGKLTVTLIVAGGSGRFVPDFALSVGPRDDPKNRGLEVYIPPSSIRIAPNLARMPF